MNKKKLFSDYIFNLMRVFMNIGLPIFVLPYVLNRIGPENYGVFTYTNSVISYFTMIAVLGIPDHASRTIAALTDHDEIVKTTSEIWTLQIISVTLTQIIFYTAFYPFVSEEYKSVYLILSLIIGANYFNVEWFYHGRLNFKYMSVRAITFKILNAIALVLFIREGDDYFKYALIATITSLGNGVVNLFGLLPYIRFRNLDLKKHIKPIIVLFGLSLTAMINNNIDKTLTGKLVGPLYVGFYAIGYRLSMLVQQLFSALNHIIYPRIAASLAEKNEKQIENLIRFNMNYIMLFSIPIILGMALYGRDVIILLFEPEMLPATGALIILSGAIPIIAILNVIRRHILLPRKLDKTLILISIITICTNVCLNLIFVPRYFHIGAAGATVVAEGIGLIFGLVYIEKRFKIKLFRWNQLRYLVSTPILLLPYFLIPAELPALPSILVLFIKIVVSILMYLILVILLRDELLYGKIFKKVISKLLHRSSMDK